MEHKIWPSAYQNSSKSIIERNDCVVRALTETFNLNYDEAHLFAEKNLNRKPRKGVAMTANKLTELSQKNTTINNFSIHAVPNKEITYFGTKTKIGMLNGDEKELHRMTVGMFLRLKKVGRYLILVKGHAFSIVDGVIIGNKKDTLCLRCRILNVFEAK